MNKFLCALLALLAFLCLVVVMFNVPWAHVRQGGGNGGYAQRTVTTWQDQHSAGFGGFSGGDSKGWYENGWNDSDQGPVDKLRIAAPLLAGAAVLLLLGALLAAAVPGMVSAITVLAGAVAAIVATILFSIASQDILDGQQTWQLGFYVAIAGCAIGLAAGVVGLMAGNARGRAS